MINSKTSSIAALLALAMSGMYTSATNTIRSRKIDDENYSYRPSRNPKSGTFIGKHKPAGSKLARMAAKGQIGINKIR